MCCPIEKCLCFSSQNYTFFKHYFINTTIPYVDQETSACCLAAKDKTFLKLCLIKTMSPCPQSIARWYWHTRCALDICSNSIWSKHVLHSVTLNIYHYINQLWRSNHGYKWYIWSTQNKKSYWTITMFLNYTSYVIGNFDTLTCLINKQIYEI